MFVYSSVLYIIYLNFNRIFHDWFQLFMENLNEAFFLITLYHMVIFGGLTRDPEFMHYLGISMISSVVIILLIGSLVIMTINIQSLKRKLKLKKMKSSRNALIEKRNKAVGEIRLLADENAKAFYKDEHK